MLVRMDGLAVGLELPVSFAASGKAQRREFAGTYYQSAIVPQIHISQLVDFKWKFGFLPKMRAAVRFHRAIAGFHLAK
jgi:hypothetical protein